MYTGIALCSFDEYYDNLLCEVPAFKTIGTGTEVLVQTNRGKLRGKVIYDTTMQDTSKEFKLLITATESYLPLPKVLGMYSYYPFHYVEEKDSAEKDGTIREVEE